MSENVLVKFRKVSGLPCMSESGLCVKHYYQGRVPACHSTKWMEMTDWWSAITDTYPPLTPMNCRFFFVEGEPGSPSAFRFIMDLRD